MTLTSRSVAGREGVRMLALVAGSVLTVVGAAAPAPTAAGDTPRTGDLSLTEVGRMRQPRAGAAAVRLADGRVLIVGGTSGERNDDGDTRMVLDTAEVFDPASGTWADAGTMAVPRANAAAAALPDGRVLVTGGRPIPTHAHDPMGSSTSEIWDPATGDFSPTGPMLQGRSGHTATTLSDGRVLVIGGIGLVEEGSDLGQFEARTTHGAKVSAGSLRSAEVWTDGSFTTAGSMIGTRANHVAVLLPGDRVLVAGGYSEVGSSRGGRGGIVSSVEVSVGPDTGFGVVGSPPGYLRASGGVLLPDGRVVLCCLSGDDEVAQLVIYLPGDMATTRMRAPDGWGRGSLVALPDGRILAAWGSESDQRDGQPVWGVDALDLSTGIVNTVVPDDVAASGDRGTDTERRVWDGSGVLVGLGEGQVLMAGGHVLSGLGTEAGQASSDHAYVITTDPDGR